MLLSLEKDLRPIRRNTSPITGDYSDYTDAKTELISRIGSGWSNGKHISSYCSYCERKIDTSLAVEHIEPKGGSFAKPHLKGRWDNFLLACVNCNSTKGSKEVILNDILLPDRDNTFYAFKYKADGNIEALNTLNSLNLTRANNTLALIGLDKESREAYDDKGNLIAQDRASQRIQVWGIADKALKIYIDNPTNQDIKDLIVENMLLSGFFSVWMIVFDSHQDMKNLFIDSIHGTKESECFNLITANAISPHPNLDSLAYGNKI